MGHRLVEETAAERVLEVCEGGVVGLVAILRAGDIMVMDEETTVDILLVGPLISIEVLW